MERWSSARTARGSRAILPFLVKFMGQQVESLRPDTVSSAMKGFQATKCTMNRMIEKATHAIGAIGARYFARGTGNGAPDIKIP